MNQIGAAGVARFLAAKLNATAVLARYSRLIIDPNRPLGDPDCIPAMSDGTPIPANADLSAEDIAAREALMTKDVRAGKPITEVMGINYEQMLHK